jgi:hypothetical protein
MKMYAGLGTNELFAETNDGKLAPLVELIILTEGRKYIPGHGTEKISVIPEIKTTRMWVSSLNIEDLITSLREIQSSLTEAAERIAARMLAAATIAEVPEPPAEGSVAE